MEQTQNKSKNKKLKLWLEHYTQGAKFFNRSSVGKMVTAIDAAKDAQVAARKARQRSILQARERKIVMLYEEYIHLLPVQETWNSPVTEAPVLEPIFAAGMQGVELGFVLLSEFIKDSRTYVVKRPRIELVAEDIRKQYMLLAEIVDGELEDENMLDSVKGSLTQTFPFPNSPPTVTRGNPKCARQSPALDMVIGAIEGTYDSLSACEKQSLKKVIRTVTGTFQTCFSDWTVGVGIEEQLSQIREMVGLPPLTVRFGMSYLDFSKLVRPEIITGTLTGVQYEHKEDFFFRSVHLGTECWAFIALERLRSAREQIAKYNNWHDAAAHVRSAAHILDYLGGHVMMLTSMVLRDYLRLKVEIEGTSGAGSSAVKQLKSHTEALYGPLKASLLAQSGRKEEDLQDVMMNLYQHPDKSPGLYDYAKALEAVESGLLGGFYYRHYCLAANVIGTGAKGTMKMAVQALKKTYENPIFPLLDVVRAELGRQTDEELVHLKGRIMDRIERKSLTSKKSSGCPMKAHHKPGIKSCPMFDEPASPNPVDECKDSESVSSPGNFEALRSNLYSDKNVPKVFQDALESEGENSKRTMPKISFLDHAWGKTPPLAQVAAAKRQYALYQTGNSTWDVMFGEVMVESSTYVKRLLHADEDCTIEFGHNSHELVSRLLSIKMDKLFSTQTEKLRILTTDTEFYSFTRQMNRLNSLGTDRIIIDHIDIEPLNTFERRFAEKATEAAYDFVYVSQCVFLTQETIITNVDAFTRSVRTSLGAEDPFIIVDGYHGFGAVPTDLSNMQKNTFYVSGILKHVGCGANCAFVVVPAHNKPLQPLFTGWLADPSVLTAESAGIKIGSDVGYMPGVALMGGTPAFLPSLLIFLEVMRRWSEKGITVSKIHNHVLAMHQRLLDHLPESGVISKQTLYSLLSRDIRSHTLVFKQESPVVAKKVVQSLLITDGIEVDSRKAYIRIGFGFNHGAPEVDKLIVAITHVNQTIE